MSSKSQEIIVEKYTTETFSRASCATSEKIELKNGNAQKIKSESNDHPAYQLYKDSGEYWNAVPKTDYTYSKYSPHRRELANGVIAMPNMSRRSIHRDETPTTALGEIGIDEKFHSKITVRKRLNDFFRRISFGGAADLQRFRKTEIHNTTETSSTTFYMRIVTFLSVITQRLLWWRRGEAEQEDMVARQSWKFRQREERESFGWFRSITSSVSSIFSRFLSYFSYIYTLIAYSVVMSTKLLQKTTQERLNLMPLLGYLLLLLLIPLLIVTGLWIWPFVALQSNISTPLPVVITPAPPAPAIEPISYVTTTVPSSNDNQLIYDLTNTVNELLIKINHLEHSNRLIKNDVLEDVKHQLKSQENLIKNTNSINFKLIEDKFNNLINDKTSTSANLNEFNCDHCSDLIKNEVKLAVASMLRIYDADKTGLTDYALETAGGQVISTRCTEHYYLHTKQLTVFGVPIYNINNNSPRVAITPGLNPGECWAFQGFPGYLLIKLSHPIKVTGVTMEHIPKLIAPKQQIDSAPKQFSVWALNSENDENPVKIGEFVFEDNGESLQYFGIDEKEVTQLVELRISSNHGNWKYTCLYRFRVHGVIPP